MFFYLFVLDFFFILLSISLLFLYSLTSYLFCLHYFCSHPFFSLLKCKFPVPFPSFRTTGESKENSFVMKANSGSNFPSFLPSVCFILLLNSYFLKRFITVILTLFYDSCLFQSRLIWAILWGVCGGLIQESFYGSLCVRIVLVFYRSYPFQFRLLSNIFGMCSFYYNWGQNCLLINIILAGICFSVSNIMRKCIKVLLKVMLILLLSFVRSSQFRHNIPF